LIFLSSLIPNQLQSFRVKGKLHYKIETNSFGVLNEEEAIGLYRTQQIFNMLINEIFSSLLISAHHVSYMIILLGISFIAITSPEIIWTSGPQLSVRVEFA